MRWATWSLINLPKPQESTDCGAGSRYPAGPNVSAGNECWSSCIKCVKPTALQKLNKTILWKVRLHREHTEDLAITLSPPKLIAVNVLSIFFYTLKKKWTLGMEIKLFGMTLTNSTLIPQAAELTSAPMCQEAYNSVTSPGEKWHKCLLTPDRTSTTDQGNNSSKVNLVFIGVTYRNRDDSQVALSSWNAHPTWVMATSFQLSPLLADSSLGLRVYSFRKLLLL